MRIVFFGTPDFAVPSLRALLGEGFHVVATVTQPDRPRGRSRSRLVPPPVKTVAIEENLTVLQPDRPADPAFLNAMRALEPDLGVVVAYGHILTPTLLAVPRHGMVNVHASLLPRFRGAAPIQHAILAGCTETGVSIMQMDAGMDTGGVLHRAATPVAPDETAGELQSRLAELGALALIETLTMVELGKASPEPQHSADATFAPRITRDSARIDWTRSATDIHRLVRAMDPAPGAWTTFQGRDIKLFGPRVGAWPAATPGEILDESADLTVATAQGSVAFAEIQPAGRPRMPAVEWLHGHPRARGQRFE